MEMLFLLMVMSDNKQILQRITNVLVADSAFSKKPFIDNMLGIGFNVVSRLRHDVALYYLWDGAPTGKPGRPRVKGEKIDFKNIDKSKVAILDTDKSNEQVHALKAWCKSLHRKISLFIHILPKGGHRLYFSTDENMSGRDVMECWSLKNYFITFLVVSSLKRTMLRPLVGEVRRLPLVS